MPNVVDTAGANKGYVFEICCYYAVVTTAVDQTREIANWGRSRNGTANKTDTAQNKYVVALQVTCYELYIPEP